MEIRDLAYAARLVPNSRGAFNLGIARLKNKDETLTSLKAWLETPAVIELANSKGMGWARSSWSDATDNLQNRAKGHEAFGNNKPGHPPQKTFSLHDNVAAYVEHRVRSRHQVDQIMEDVRQVLGNGTPSERVLRRCRQRLGHLSDDDIANMAADSRTILKLPL
jgi:hypothetical protein